MEKEQYLNVSRPHKQCLLCGCELTGIEKHPSTLTSWDNEVMRKDFCPKCWEQIESKDYFSYWITKRIVPDSNRRLSKKERNNLLLRLFESLYRNPDESKVYPLFFLAHILMRYKVFQWKGTRSVAADDAKTAPTETGAAEQTFLIFENKLTGEEIQIPDQELDGEKIIESKKEIDEFLSTNLPEDFNQNE